MKRNYNNILFMLRRPVDISRTILLLLFGFLLLNLSADAFDFVERPQNYSARLGARVTLRCSVPPSHTKFDTQSQWRTNTGALLSFHETGPLPGYGGRYSYLKDGAGELHLQIENLSLADDGKFECQMLRPPNKFLRAAAYVTVLVSPTEVSFLDHPSSGTIQISEDTSLNVTCAARNAKPEPEMNIFINGKRIVESIQRWTNRLENGTADSFLSIAWRPSKKDHNKLLACEVNHVETGFKARNALTLNVLYSSDRPKINLLGGAGGETDRLKAGQNITLVCSAEGGNPPPRLLWSNQAGVINSTYEYDYTNQITRNSLSFPVRGVDNGAIYECSSSNRENVAALKKTVVLNVDYPPNAVYLYGSTTVRKGESVVVSCTTGTSSPASSILWTINGSPTQPQPQSEKRQAQGVATESNITVDSSTLLSGQNQITVECTASNGEGTPASNQHIIRVLSPPSMPTIYEQLADENAVALLEGGLLNLTCETQGGHPLATLSWYRGVEKMKEASGGNHGDVSRSVLTLQLDRSMNQQQIRCEAENGATDEPLVAKKTLSVLFPPHHVKIHQMEGSHHHMVADVANRLTCHVPSSNPPAEITWEFDSSQQAQMAGGGGAKIAKSGQYIKRSTRPIGEYRGYEVENVIQFVPTEEMDKTVVRCIASHPQWTATRSASFPLDVMYPPRVAVDGPLTVVVGEGEAFEETLTVHANPRPTNFQWRKNGVGVERTIGAVYVRGSTIGSRAVGKEDAGVYTLNASNRIGTTNVSLRLTVEYPAYVTYITSPVIAGVGEHVVLECEADGVPARHGMVKWMRGDVELKSSEHAKRAVLRFNATHENGGAYRCVADNGIGRPNHTFAYLLVRRAPVILRTRELERAAGPLGGRATLRCRAVGVPNVEFSWGVDGDGQMIAHNTSKYKFFDSQLDHSTFQSTLTIMNLDERDFARRYRCRASNRLGLEQIYVTVSPPSEPDVPLDLQVLNVTDTTASLGWTPGFDGGSAQIFELRYQAIGDAEFRVLNASESRVQIGGLKAEERYRVQIRAINLRGSASEFSTPVLQFRTLDEHMQGVYRVAADTAWVLSPAAVLAVIIAGAVLLLVNVLLICLCRRNKRKKYQEKTEIARSLNHNGAGINGARPIQIYGTMIGGTGMSNGHVTGTPILANNRRPDSTNTNKSELLNEPLTSEDNQSVRTIIEVNPNGYMMTAPSQGVGQPQAPLFNNNQQTFYDSQHCVADYESSQDFYSPINKPLLNHGTTYAAVPYPEPPYSTGSLNPSLMYADIGSLGGSNGGGGMMTFQPSPAVRHRAFNGGGSRSDIGPAGSVLMVTDPTQNGGGNYNYVFHSSNYQNGGGSGVTTGAGRSPRMLSTFGGSGTVNGGGGFVDVSNESSPPNGSTMLYHLHNNNHPQQQQQPQFITSSNNNNVVEGDLV